jgi:hypothetical protein
LGLIEVLNIDRVQRLEPVKLRGALGERQRIQNLLAHGLGFRADHLSARNSQRRLHSIELMKDVFTGLPGLDHVQHCIQMTRRRSQALYDLRLSVEFHEMAPLGVANQSSDGSECAGQTIQGFGVTRFLLGLQEKSMFCHLVHGLQA